jgi:thymidylate kinase
LRRHVRRALARYRTYNSIEAPLRASWRSLHWVIGALNQRLLHWPRPWSKRAPGGGIVVAILGVDGSGKSTLVRGLRSWLDQDVDVLTIYFGTGDGRPAWFLLPLKLLVPVASLVLRRKPHGSSHGEVTDSAPGLAYSVLLSIWATVLAVEKRTKLRAARRAAARGMVVITDRFPQDQIADFNDGPLLPRLSHVPRWLRKFEASAYALAGRLPPDLVIKLVATPELIAAREPTMSPAVIRSRTTAVARLTFAGSSVAAIPAGQPAADVLRAVKAEIWRML